MTFMPVLRFFVKFGIVVFGLVIVFVVWMTLLVWHDSTVDNAKPGADAIVVLGAAQYNGHPSPVLRARLDHAADLWKQHYASVIVVTGGKVPGDISTEAGASAAYLATKGVPDASVLREVQGRSSWQSLEASARFLHDRNAHTVILVSDPFHNARIAAMAKALGLHAEVSATRTSPITGNKRLPYFGKEIVDLSLGKLFGFSHIASLERSFAS